ncbi:MAG: hypothetical protein H0V35_14795 [Nitrospira sp.]|nr:hypothetical protein [Nitrospira sp.]
MTRWIGMFIVVGWGSVMTWSPVEARDHSMAKSLTRTGPAVQVGHARTCSGHDLVGNWLLVAFDSSYRFRNPQAPYLFPHQVFQYATRGGAKSAHSLRPISGNPEKLFETVPLEMTYRVERSGRVILKSKGHDESLETWSCKVVTQDHEAEERGSAMRHGDLVMTLQGTGGQTLFVRHLRKSAA